MITRTPYDCHWLDKQIPCFSHRHMHNEPTDRARNTKKKKNRQKLGNRLMKVKMLKAWTITTSTWRDRFGNTSLIDMLHIMEHYMNSTVIVLHKKKEETHTHTHAYIHTHLHASVFEVWRVKRLHHEWSVCVCKYHNRALHRRAYKWNLCFTQMCPPFSVDSPIYLLKKQMRIKWWRWCW